MFILPCCFQDSSLAFESLVICLESVLAQTGSLALQILLSPFSVFFWASNYKYTGLCQCPMCLLHSVFSFFPLLLNLCSSYYLLVLWSFLLLKFICWVLKLPCDLFTYTYLRLFWFFYLCIFLNILIIFIKSLSADSKVWIIGGCAPIACFLFSQCWILYI